MGDRKLAGLTKVDTVALWHAVDWMALCLKQQGEFTNQDALTKEREHLATARRALRKVNALRRGDAGGGAT